MYLSGKSDIIGLNLSQGSASDDYQLLYPLELQMATFEDWYQMMQNWTIALSLKYGDMKIGITTVLNVVAAR